ncbi:MAG: hypothetical protein KIH10_14720 [Candidatus Freyarchaeota archaeon]|nr:hypothetical protein [Candidatus Jordarchaeia archaeon]MBS7280737.1 hypothetical protein [Candidatus Jordarchaeia archaeon]
MTDSQKSKEYGSIIDCPICRNLPQKKELDLEHVGQGKVPAELNQLSVVLLFNLEPEHQYSSNTVKLLKCPKCGTYYYFNHYVDEGEHFMDPTSNDILIRRYPPLTVIHFLEGIINEIPGTFPQPIGKLKVAFMEGRYPYPNEPSEKGRGESLETVTKELGEIKGRYNTIIEEFTDVVKEESPEWHLKKYMVESLAMHFAKEDDWSSISELLLKHKDPVIRVEALSFLVDYSLGNAGVIDLIHVPYDIREKLEKIVKRRKKHLDEIVQVASELALSKHGYTYEYDPGFGESKYYKASIQAVGLQNIAVLARYRDLSHLVPQLINLLSEDENLNYHVCWTLEPISKESRENAKLILELINKVDRKIRQDKEVQRLIKECEEQIKKRKKGKEKKKKPT